MSKASSIELLDSTSIPWLAWGNGTGKAKKDAIASGKLVLESGIRHLDTAQIYENEEETGIAIKKSGVSKEDVYVTSKLWFSATLEQVRESVKSSLDRLDFVPDLYLIHSPFVVQPKQLKQLWNIFEDLKDEGKLKSIGVSNFRPQDLETILDGARYKPVVNQIEFHPYTLAHLEPLLELQAKHGIATTSYGALTPILRHPTGGPLKPILARIAQRLSQKYEDDTINSLIVLLLWTKAKSAAAITTSGNPNNIRSLAKVYRSNWELDPEEVEEIARVGKTIHFRYYTEHMEKDFPPPNLPSQ